MSQVYGDEVVARSADDVLAELPVPRQAIWRYYGLTGESLDGYPLSRNSRGLSSAHPIHGTYLILEHLRGAVNPATRDVAVARALRVAEASVARMETVDGTLRFLYQDEAADRVGDTFYSALTQGHYLNVLGRLYERAPSRLLERWMEAIFRSLLVPVDEGGVLLRQKDRVSLEEYPAPFPSFVLNGWLTVVNEVFEYGYLMQNSRALDLAQENAATLARMLPLYDAPEHWSSRYKLTGHVSHKIFFSGGIPEIERISVHHDGLVAHVTDLTTSARDVVHVVSLPSEEQAALSFKATASIAGYPAPSLVTVRLCAPCPLQVEWRVSVPQNDPRYVTPRAVGQRQMLRSRLEAGTTELKLEVPLDLVMGWAGGPTAFSKNIEGRRYNTYHYLHIKALTQLYEFTAFEKIRHWRDRWLQYSSRWPTHQPYLAPDVDHSVVDIGRHPDAASYLCEPRVRLQDGRIRRTPSPQMTASQEQLP